MGCDSEVDKCIDAKWKYHLIRLKDLRKSIGLENSDMDKKTELKHKLDFRMECLKAQSGKEGNEKSHQQDPLHTTLQSTGYQRQTGGTNGGTKSIFKT